MSGAAAPLHITVFAGSSRRASELHRAAARCLGVEIARRGHVLVYGGGRTGLMGALADAALGEGGTVQGVILREFIDQDVHHTSVPMETVEDMRSRKAGLDARAHAFVALPGGFGTLEELAEILSFRKLGHHHRPLVLLNVGGYYDPLLAWVENAIADGFEKAERRAFLAVTEDPARAVDLCEQVRR